MRQVQGRQKTLPPGWLKRLGLGGFVFFLAKGLLWLMVPAFLAVAGLE